jgi:hypothetical protein
MALVRKEIKLRVPYTFGLIYYLYNSQILRDCATCKDAAKTSRKYAHIPSGANSTRHVMVICL